VVLGLLMALTLHLGIAGGVRSLEFVAGGELALLACLLICRFALPLVARREQGALAEEQVGALLDALVAAGWRVIHDVRLGSGNVDHILVGPPGVFTVETKSRAAEVNVRRVHPDTLRQARAQAHRVARITGVPVEPLVVFSRAWVDRPLRRRRGVRIVPARMVLAYLTRQDATLAPEQVDAIGRQLIAAAAPLRRPALMRSVYVPQRGSASCAEEARAVGRLARRSRQL
jgi:hypothetical protein